MTSRRARAAQLRSNIMRAAMLGTILLIVLILLLVGAIPSWPHSRSWGYGPSGLLGVVLVVVLILALTGRV
jgi:Na+/melibiose symporter-like transporter